MYASSYNQGLKAVIDVPSTPLAVLRAPEVYFDGKKVRYGKDDNSLLRGAPPPLAGPQGEDTVDKPLKDLISSGFPSRAVSVTHSNE